MKKIKNKKTLIILLVLLIGVIGITIAYFSNSTVLDNLFSTKPYGTTYIETFVSPDNWLPGDTIDKTLVVTNSGEVDEAVRISYTEEWKSNNGTTLSGLIDEFGKLTDEEENSDKAAIINFSNTDDWTYNNGYYYYNYRLKPNETTSSFIESVTFNPKVTLGDTCTETESNGVKIVTCSSSGDDYDNATYKLTLTIETVQYNKYMSAWSTDVAIANEQLLFCDSFEVGEVVDYNGSEYYVLKDSSTSDDYVTLLKKDPLTAEEVNQYSTSYVSQDGEYPYYESDACNDNDQTGCSTNYDISDVKKVVDGWSSSFSDDLVEIDGYKTRFVNYDDLFNNLDFYIDFYKPCSMCNYFNECAAGDNTPKWMYTNNNAYMDSYWSMAEINKSGFENELFGVKNRLSNNKVYNKLYIRPVINLKKNLISGNCQVNNKPYLICDFGDEVIYNGESYYVLEDSDSSKKSVVLLKANLLTMDEINMNSFDYVSENGEYPYYESENCNSSDQTNCSNDYNTSSIKRIIDNWSSTFKDDLINIDGYQARLIKGNLKENFYGYKYYYYDITHDSYKASSKTPKWIYINGSKYWTMGTNYDNSNLVRTVIDEELANFDVYNKAYVRPVIYLNKKAIESGCSLSSYDSYYEGESITYNNENYCVVAKSLSNKDYVTLIKQEPLTYDELLLYNNGYEINRDTIDNNSGIISYYKSNTCYYNDNHDNNVTGCSNDYNNSFIKNIVNNWSNSFSNDLKEVNNYKARLITNDELNNMGHIYTGNTSGSPVNKSNYNCLYSDADYWTMSISGDWSFKMDIISKIDNNNGPHEIDKMYAVRPVINLKKCAITNTCE